MTKEMVNFFLFLFFLLKSLGLTARIAFRIKISYKIMCDITLGNIEDFSTSIVTLYSRLFLLFVFI